MCTKTTTKTHYIAAVVDFFCIFMHGETVQH